MTTGIFSICNALWHEIANMNPKTFTRTGNTTLLFDVAGIVK